MSEAVAWRKSFQVGDGVLIMNETPTELAKGLMVGDEVIFRCRIGTTSKVCYGVIQCISGNTFTAKIRHTGVYRMAIVNDILSYVHK